MTTTRYSCPSCGSIDLQISELASTWVCPICEARGELRDAVGFVTSESVWDIEKVAEVSLRVVAKHSAGPLLQLWEFVGIVPRMKEITREVTGPRRRAYEAWNARVQEIRDNVLRAVMASSLSAAFEVAHAAREVHPELFAAEEPESTTETAEN